MINADNPRASSEYGDPDDIEVTDTPSETVNEALGMQGRSLDDRHLQELLDSAISASVIADRGYFTAHDKGELPTCFKGIQRELVPALILPIWSVDDTRDPVGYRMKPDEPREERRGAAAEPRPRKYEQPSGVPMRLDVPPRVRRHLDDPSRDLWITEGEKKADSAASAGLDCVALTGVWSWRTTGPKGGKVELGDFDKIAWNGRRVILAFDSDLRTNEHVMRALRRLSAVMERRGASVHAIDWPEVPGAKGALDDYLFSHTVEDLLRLVVPVHEVLSTPEQLGPVERCWAWLSDHYEFVMDSNGTPIALPVDGPRVVHRLTGGSPSIEAHAIREFESTIGPTAVMKRQDITNVIARCDREARASGERHTIHMRCAYEPEKQRLVKDLGRSDYLCIVHTSTGWYLDVPSAENDLPLFHRPDKLGVIPVPERGGTLESTFKPLLNVSEESWKLVKGWMIGAHFEGIPRPIAEHSGPQGSGKSDAAFMAVEVIDPNGGLQPMPRKGGRGDIEGSLVSRYLFGYDNVVFVEPDISDLLCSVVTGTSDERRVLHTTDTMRSVQIMSTGVMTGIGIAGMQADLIERLIHIEFARITDTKRRARSAVMREYAESKARIVGALADAVVAVLANVDGVDDAAMRLPRMADYALLLAAHDAATGSLDDGLYAAYVNAVTAASTERALEHPVMSALVTWLERKGGTSAPLTATELMTELERVRLSQIASGSRLSDDAQWPSNAQSLSRRLKKLDGGAETIVRFEWSRDGENRTTVAFELVSDTDDTDENAGAIGLEGE